MGKVSAKQITYEVQITAKQNYAKQIVQITIKLQATIYDICLSIGHIFGNEKKSIYICPKIIEIIIK
ncbi:MAG: hypothetical protein DRJ05_20085 [Bacteroidetes bacterium]|nr:MAG: hypothetical protein DRJ05_20085 [Bacteroidota bacterium]